MTALKKVTTHEFVQHTSQYLKMSEKGGCVIITYHGHPKFVLTLIKEKTIHSLQGLLDNVKVEGDINDPILPGYDKW